MIRYTVLASRRVTYSLRFRLLTKKECILLLSACHYSGCKYLSTFSVLNTQATITSRVSALPKKKQQQQQSDHADIMCSSRS